MHPYLCHQPEGVFPQVQRRTSERGRAAGHPRERSLFPPCSQPRHLHGSSRQGSASQALDRFTAKEGLARRLMVVSLACSTQRRRIVLASGDTPARVGNHLRAVVISAGGLDTTRCPYGRQNAQKKRYERVVRHFSWTCGGNHSEHGWDRNSLTGGDSSVNIIASALPDDTHRTDMSHYG
jgi:hypothetical protein